MQTSLSSSLTATVQALLAPGKGILAADESGPTIEKRFKTINLPSTEDNRRAYREMLFTAKDVSQYISGVILFDETLRQKSSAGIPFPQLLEKAGIIPGIKVDEGTKPLANFPGETVTEGLDGLRERFAEYAKLGARFAKWRATYVIGPELPSCFSIAANAHALARYAALCQEAGLVPIVEPEVLADGTHSIDRCYEVTVHVFKAVFDALYEHKVCLKGMLLKPSMITQGHDAPPVAVNEVAERTLQCLRQTLPAAVPGAVFLSGGQSEEQATAHLNAMNQKTDLPWALTFSYGRALQNSALAAWKGQPANVAAGQGALLHRARMNSLARAGKYTAVLESARG